MGLRIRKGDTVEIIAGREKGKRGKIIRILSSNHDTRVLVERLNMIKRHMRRSAKYKEGGIIDMEGPIHISNVSLVCPKCDKRTRIGSKPSGDKNVRYCKKCNEIID